MAIVHLSLLLVLILLILLILLLPLVLLLALILLVLLLPLVLVLLVVVHDEVPPFSKDFSPSISRRPVFIPESNPQCPVEIPLFSNESLKNLLSDHTKSIGIRRRKGYAFDQKWAGADHGGNHPSPGLRLDQGGRSSESRQP